MPKLLIDLPVMLTYTGQSKGLKAAIGAVDSLDNESFSMKMLDANLHNAYFIYRPFLCVMNAINYLA